MFQLEKVANTIFRWFLLPLVCAASHHHTFRPGTARLLSRAGAGDSQIAVCSQLSHGDRVSNAASAISSAKKKKKPVFRHPSIAAEAERADDLKNVEASGKTSLTSE